MSLPLRTADGRTIESMFVSPPHEALHREIEEHGMPHQVPEEWMPAFEQHPFVKGKTLDERDRMVPLAVYMDAVEYSDKDSVLVCSITNLLTGRKHVVFVARKSSLCGCGCGNWCSLYVLFRFVQWSLTHASEGMWASTRHDGSPFTSCMDESRRTMKGMRLCYTGVVIDLNGDWMEFTSRYGLPSWSSATAPCFKCMCTQENWYKEPEEIVNGVNSHDEDFYDNEAIRHEVWVTITTMDQLMQVRHALRMSPALKGR
ncbi:unnamed protein product, partial [Prorocentrum cordatum]